MDKNFDDLSVLNSELGSELLQLKMNQEDYDNLSLI